MGKRIKISGGDIFRFSAGTDGYGYGQVLVTDIIQYIVVFEPVFSSTATIEEVIREDRLLAGWSSDALMWHGQWLIVGNAPPIDFTFPQYKIQIEGQTWVTDFKGKSLRLATTDEARDLRFHTSNAPITFERAFKAYHGLLPWKAHYDELRLEA
ncbi:MAG TPA: Imm26 family immunity protein [Allosphingosinicella sp.]|nr:Imm26 family immunity protein [Allosphingosinicella sp.]